MITYCIYVPYVGVEITSNFCPLGIDEKSLPRHSEENFCTISLNAALTCIFFLLHTLRFIQVFIVIIKKSVLFSLQ